MKDGSTLVITDDFSTRTALKQTLGDAGFVRIHFSPCGDGSLDEVFARRPALVVLDRDFPDGDGLDVCRAIRDAPSVCAAPVVMLAAKADDVEVVAGLDAGADDYVAKPFSAAVLSARIRAVMRRPLTPRPVVAEMDGLTLDSSAREVVLNGAEIALTPSEFGILELLLSSPGRVYTRSHIIDAVQGEEKAVTDRTVDVQLVGLRRKLGEWSRHIKSVRGIGYRLEKPAGVSR